MIGQPVVFPDTTIDPSRLRSRARPESTGRQQRGAYEQERRKSRRRPGPRQDQPNWREEPRKELTSNVASGVEGGVIQAMMRGSDRQDAAVLAVSCTPSRVSGAPGSAGVEVALQLAEGRAYQPGQLQPGAGLPCKDVLRVSLGKVVVRTGPSCAPDRTSRDRVHDPPASESPDGCAPGQPAPLAPPSVTRAHADPRAP